MRFELSILTTLALALALAACGDPGGDDATELEVITTVTLRFAPEAGPPLTFAFDDPDGDGGAAPTIDPIAIAPGTYDLSVTFENRLEDPPEDITAEIRDEAEEHQVFFTGTAVDGPAAANPGAPLAHAYADNDARGNPLGLAGTITATAGTGELVVTLLHLPPVGGEPIKTADLSDRVRTDGLAAAGGETDASVTFPVSVE